MLRIGDFSKLCQVTIKTLRYYDQMGLLKPISVDASSGYRFYSVEQITQINRILAYKGLGFTLDQIATLLEEDLPVAQIRGMLRLMQAEVQQSVDKDLARLAQIEARLRLIEEENDMPTEEIIVKQVPSLKVAALRAIAPSYGVQGTLWEELETFLAQNSIKPTGPCLTVYYDSEYREKDVDLEVCEPVAVDLPAHENINTRTLPAVATMACLIHAGSYDSLTNSYGALSRWIEANGYRIVGPNREVYLHNVEHTNNVSEYLTELQFPVTKA